MGCVVLIIVIVFCFVVQFKFGLFASFYNIVSWERDQPATLPIVKTLNAFQVSIATCNTKPNGQFQLQQTELWPSLTQSPPTLKCPAAAWDETQPPKNQRSWLKTTSAENRGKSGKQNAKKNHDHEKPSKTQTKTKTRTNKLNIKYRILFKLIINSIIIISFLVSFYNKNKYWSHCID